MTRTPAEAALEYALCLQTGEFDRLVTLHHPDLICNLLGTTLVSGKFEGRDDFYAHTFKYVLGEFPETDEIYHKGSHLVCSDENCAVLLLHGGLATRSGKRYDQNYLQIFRVEEGLIVELHELLDTAMVETAIFNRQLSIARSAPVEPLRPETRFNDPEGLHPKSSSTDLLQRFINSIEANDLDSLIALTHPNCVLQIAGSTPASGCVRGRDAIAGVLSGYGDLHFQTINLTKGQLRLACADDTGFCLLAEFSGTLHSGAEYQQIIGIVGQYCGDSIGETHLYFDTAAEELQVYDNPLSGGGARPGMPFSIHSTREAR